MARVTLLLIKGNLMAFRLEGANHDACKRGQISRCSLDCRLPGRQPSHPYTSPPRPFDPHKVGILSPFCLNGGGFHVKTQSSFAGGLRFAGAGPWPSKGRQVWRKPLCWHFFALPCWQALHICRATLMGTRTRLRRGATALKGDDVQNKDTSSRVLIVRRYFTLKDFESLVS